MLPLSASNTSASADTTEQGAGLLTVPNQLGVDYSVHLIDSVLRHLAPELGWR